MNEIFFSNLLNFSISIIPSFLFALFISVLFIEYLPKTFYEKILTSNNFFIVFLASILGALIPICTCGMIPLANKIYSKGASPKIVISFLTSGFSCSISALIMTIPIGIKITFLRFIFSVLFGIGVSYLFLCFTKVSGKIISNHCHEEEKVGFLKKTFNEFLILLKDFGPWVLVSIFIGTLISTFLDKELISSLINKENIFSPFILGISAFPFYFCAGTDIPISKALLEKGVPIGSVLSFMTLSPGVNITSFLFFQKWLGIKNSFIYLFSCVFIGSILGLSFNLFF